MEAIKKLLKGKRTLVFLDLEGTQFSHEIIAIGAVKVSVNEKGNIINIEKAKKFKQYVKPLGQIGKFVSNMTSITEDILREQGVTLEQTFKDFKDFVRKPFNECAFIVFGSNDVKMIVDSISYSKPVNDEIGYNICKNSIDYLAFCSQYIKDDNGNNYSLVNYLKVFNIEPYGVSHDPLNDSIDLMNLYNALDTQKDILLNEYIKVLQKQRLFPAPIKKIINDLIEGKNVTADDFIQDCREYLE